METLIEQAKQAREFAHVPYSQFKVGAALKTKDGSVYTGCNVENASYGLTNCAERTAVFKAVSSGNKDIEEIAIVADTENAVAPCGACRQVLSEFMAPEAVIVLSNLEGNTVKTTMQELLPGAFQAGDMR